MFNGYGRWKGQSRSRHGCTGLGGEGLVRLCPGNAENCHVIRGIFGARLEPSQMLARSNLRAFSAIELRSDPVDNEIPQVRNSCGSEIFLDPWQTSIEAHVFHISQHQNVSGKQSCVNGIRLKSGRQFVHPFKANSVQKVLQVHFSDPKCVNFCHSTPVWLLPDLFTKETMQHEDTPRGRHPVTRDASLARATLASCSCNASQLQRAAVRCVLATLVVCAMIGTCAKMPHQPKSTSFYRFKIRQPSLPESVAQAKEGRIVPTSLEPRAAFSVPF